jgi:aldehyde dehydrogenase (NAD+)
MGGQNASLVLADADLDWAASVIAQAAMGYAGQKCTATSRVIVERPVLEEFRGRLVEAVRSLPVGDPSSEVTVVGPVINAAAVDAVRDAVAGSSGKVLTGGGATRGEAEHLLEPTLVEVDHPGEDVLTQQEVFGPIAALVGVDSRDEAVRVANQVPYGLSAAVFTRDLASALTTTKELEAGLIRVNGSTAGVDFHAPFGGVKDSSTGPREQGLAAREFFTQTRTVLINASNP